MGRAGKGRVLWGAPWEEAGRPALKTRMVMNVVVNMNIILVMIMVENNDDNGDEHDRWGRDSSCGSD